MLTVSRVVRGPVFAPVVLWLADAGNAPVVPLEFHNPFTDLGWRTVDDGPPLGGRGGGVASARPVGYGSSHVPPWLFPPAGPATQ